VTSRAKPKRSTGKKAAKKAVKTRRNAAADSTRIRKLLTTLERTYRNATTALSYESPLQLLVATILSAQCTDERVNQVTPGLFAAYPTAADLADAPTEELERMIHSTGFFRQKARSIQGACRILADRHGGEVPREMDRLLELPGVARKTANVVLGTAYGIPSGVVVDTHVKRIAGRLGMSTEKDPKKIEQDLMQAIPQRHWIALSHQLILHGRALCTARKPRCDDCPLAADCPSAGLE
jgi:endonuclease-3